MSSSTTSGPGPNATATSAPATNIPAADRVRSPFLDQLGLGVRLALTSGRDGWGRLLLTACGVGLGVALLLFTASFPGIVQHRNERLYIQNDTFRDEDLPTPGNRTVLIATADTTFRGTAIRGRVVQPEGPDAALPPGVAAYPPPGRMVVSPALAELLKDPANQLLRDRLPTRWSAASARTACSAPARPATCSAVTGSRWTPEPPASPRTATSRRPSRWTPG